MRGGGMFYRLWAWWRALFGRGRLEREMQAEMRAHLMLATERLMARGLSPAAARRAALQEFGNIDLIQETARDARGGRWLEALLADTRFALRHFRRTPVASAVMLLLLALGIGVNAALFTLLHATLTQPPAGIARTDALVRIQALERDWHGSMSYPEVLAYRARTDLFVGVAAWSRVSTALDVGDVEQGAVAGSAQYVNGDYFRVLGVRPLLGPGLPESASGDALAGVISHALWEAHFGGRSDVIGQTLKVDSATITIVGVAPPRFRGAGASHAHTVWLPLAARGVVDRAGEAALSSYDSLQFHVVARLRPGVTREQAQPAVRTIARQAGAAMSEPRLNASAAVVPLLTTNERPSYGGNDDGFEYAAVIALALLILLVTCTNVSTLLIGLATSRRREIAVRLSLGAPRTRIVRQLLTESVLLAVTAGLLGLALMALLIRLYAASIPDVELALHWPVIAFTVLFACLTGIVFGLSPALHATRLAVADVLKNAAAAVSGGRSLLQRAFVVAQISLTQPLLVGLGATLLIVLGALRTQSGSAAADQVIVVRLNVSAVRSYELLEQQLETLLQGVAAMPGVAAVVPQASGYAIADLTVHPADRGAASQAQQSFRMRTHFAPAGYFPMLDIPFVRGRDFEETERRRDYSAVIIGQDLARRLWGDDNPIGRRFLRGSVRGMVAPDSRADGAGAGAAASDGRTLVVVGVVDDARAGSSEVGNELRIFVPWRPLETSPTLLVRTEGAPAAVLPGLRRIIRETTPGLPIRALGTLAAEQQEERRLILRASSAAAAAGLLALALSAIGLYAIVAFAVGQRTREIGIRTALGARRSEVVGMFFLQGVRLSLIGLAIGLPLSLLALRILAHYLRLRLASMPLLAALIAGFVIAVAAFATWLPARRAASVDPLLALRSE